MKRFVVILLLVVAVHLLGLGGLASAQIHRQVYPAPTAPLTLSGLPARAVLITVNTADGLSLKGVEIAPSPGKPTLLFLHGNASTASGAAAWLAPLVAEGYGVVAAEYRGYSGNPGRASETGLAADADAFYARARALAGEGRLIVVGHSLGGGVALGLAARQRLDALVTIGTFSRLADMAPAIARPLLRDRYDNLAAVARLDEPYFLIHGDADDVVPFPQGLALGKAAHDHGRQGAMFALRGAGHGPDGEVLAAVLRAVVARLDGAPPSPLPASVQVKPF